MLKKAFNKFSNLKVLIFHSDQGWQYQHVSYRTEKSGPCWRVPTEDKGFCGEVDVNTLMSIIKKKISALYKRQSPREM